MRKTRAYVLCCLLQGAAATASSGHWFCRAGQLEQGGRGATPDCPGLPHHQQHPDAQCSSRGVSQTDVASSKVPSMLTCGACATLRPPAVCVHVCHNVLVTILWFCVDILLALFLVQTPLQHTVHPSSVTGIYGIFTHTLDSTKVR